MGDLPADRDLGRLRLFDLNLYRDAGFRLRIGTWAFEALRLVPVTEWGDLPADRDLGRLRLCDLYL